ncbi:hypothetical protein ES708_34395 [subsurface metagenome]
MLIIDISRVSTPVSIKQFPVNSSAPPIATNIKPILNTLPPINFEKPIPKYIDKSYVIMVHNSAPKPIYIPANIPRSNKGNIRSLDFFLLISTTFFAIFPRSKNPIVFFS